MLYLLSSKTISDTLFFPPALAFAVPTSDFNIQFTQDASASLLNELVTLAHASNTKVMLSVGGWSSSNYFSTAVSTYDNRVLFVNNIVNFAKQFGVDGVDIDWEVSLRYLPCILFDTVLTYSFIVPWNYWS